MQLRAFQPQRFTESALFRATANGDELLVKVYDGRLAELRRDLECRKLTHWADSGFSVPAVFDITVPGIDQPYLVMPFIESLTLSQFLKHRDRPLQDKQAMLSAVFKDNALRHNLALSTDDPLLIHTDPNTDNVLVTRGGTVHIDFEHPSKKKKSVSQAVAQEIAAFVRRASNDLEKTHLPTTIDSMFSAYGRNRGLFRHVVDLTIGRPLQFIHRHKDRTRKRSHPQIVTRYDNADAIKQHL